MKVLFVTTTFPIPPHAGAKVALLETLRSIETLCELHLLVPRTEDNSDSDVASLRDAIPNTHLHFYQPKNEELGLIEKYTTAAVSALSRQSYHAAIWTDPNLRNAAKQLTDNVDFDIVHSEWLYPAIALQGLGLPLVVRTLDLHFVIMKDGVDQLSPKKNLRKSLWQLEAERFRKFELGIFNDALVTIAVSAEDEAVLRREGVSNLVKIPPPMSIPKSTPPRSDKAQCSALFLCMLHAYVNRDSSFLFTDEIWPLVSDEVKANVKVVFAGGRPDDAARQRAAECGIEMHAPLSDEEARQLYADADIFLSPIKTGTGIKTKTLEAMSNGKPIVGFQNSFRGVPIENGTHALVATSNEEFASLFERLVMDVELRRRIGDAARSFIHEQFNPQTLGRQLLDTYARAAESSRRTLAASGDRLTAIQ